MSSLLDRHSRIRSGQTDYIPEIDGLRFFAITTVVLYHLQTHWLRIRPESVQLEGLDNLLISLIDRLGLGVFVFFTISGFILAIPFAQHRLHGSPKINLRRYYLRRLTRIEPPYAITMIILFLAGILTHRYTFTEGVPHLAASLGYIHHFIYGEWSTINPVAWSLEIEVQFYLLAPFLVTLFFIKPPRLRLLSMLTIMLLFSILTWQGYHTLEDIHLEKSLLTTLQYFLLGFIMADIYLTQWKQKPSPFPLVADSLGLLGLLMVWYGKENLHITNQLIFLGGTSLLFFGALRGRWLRSIFSKPWLTTLGGMCYSTYLLHYAFLAVLLPITRPLTLYMGYSAGYLSQTLITLPLLLVFTATYFRLFERPFMHPQWPLQFLSWLRSERNKKSL